MSDENNTGVRICELSRKHALADNAVRFCNYVCIFCYVLTAYHVVQLLVAPNTTTMLLIVGLCIAAVIVAEIIFGKVWWLKEDILAQIQALREQTEEGVSSDS